MLPIITLHSERTRSGLRIVFSRIAVNATAPASGSRASYEEMLVYRVELYEPGVLVSVGDFIVGPENFTELHDAVSSLRVRESCSVDWNTLGAGAHTMRVTLSTGDAVRDSISVRLFLQNGDTDSTYQATLIVSESDLAAFAASLTLIGRAP